MDTSLHNSLLRVYISNNHKFSPSQFMDEMTAAGIVPNQNTFSLLLDSHCRQGDLAGAQSMLQHMYDKGHTITEQVYASLITGHSQSGDMKEAWKMIDVMEENGFEPGIPSYTALLRGHAYRGEIEQVRESLRKMIAKKLYPNHSVYIAILDSLSMGGHHSFLKEVSGYCTSVIVFIHASIDTRSYCKQRMDNIRYVNCELLIGVHNQLLYRLAATGKNSSWSWRV